LAVTWKKLAYADDVALKTLWTAKGMLVAASAANTPVGVAVGTDGQLLVADSASAGGIKYQTGATPAAHATTHKSGGSDTIKLNEFTVPDGAVDFDLQQATDLVVMTVAAEANLPAANVAKGQLCWATSEATLHVCTSAV